MEILKQHKMSLISFLNNLFKDDGFELDSNSKICNW